MNAPRSIVVVSVVVLLDGDVGCDGGDPFTAYSYVIKNGLMSGSDYPYISGDSGMNGTWSVRTP
jgi:hypothetical protein